MKARHNQTVTKPQDRKELKNLLELTKISSIFALEKL